MPLRESAPELVVGLVGAIGTDLDRVCQLLDASLSTVGYSVSLVHLSHLLDEIHDNLPQTPLDERYEAYMNAGNEFRQKHEKPEALAALAISAIRHLREGLSGSAHEPCSRHAYVLRSLKRPEEVMTLRAVYGPAFILVSVFSPREVRVQHLTQRIAQSRHDAQLDSYRPIAEALMQRDQAEGETPYGQSVLDAFPLADVFLAAHPLDSLKRSVERFIEILFGYHFHTPTADECGMFFAQAAAMRSAALGRQVGACIVSPLREVVSIGTNEVPRSGGGLHWCDDLPDARDFTTGSDSNDLLKRRLWADVLNRLKKGHWLAPDFEGKSVDDLVAESLSEPTPILKGSQLMAIIEFSRTVHAEMAAIVAAARRGVSIQDCVLYTTTFPCHDCAKHIVATGVRRVVYIEPYPKSRVPELYPDSIDLGVSGASGPQVRFEPFVGIAPSRYLTWFSALQRKKKDGTIPNWDRLRAQPRIAQDMGYQVREQEEVHRLDKAIAIKESK